MKELKGYKKGINLGGWLSQNTFTKEHLDTFIVEDDIKKISTFGVDHIRLPIDFENIENDDGSVKESGYRYIDNCINWCRKYKLNLILDLHKTCGYIFDDAEYSSDFFDSIDLQDRFINLWDVISKRYAKDSDIVMLELLNEVVRSDVAEKWNKIALRAIAKIRENSKDVKILYGGVCNSAISSVKYLAAPPDENIVYNFHCYEPLIFTHQSAWWADGMPTDFHIGYPGDVKEYMRESAKMPCAMNGPFGEEGFMLTELSPVFFENIFKEAVAYAEKNNVPLYCGEYGCIELAPPEDSLRWLRDINAAFEKFGIGRALWSYKEMNFGLIDEHYSSIFEEMLKVL